MIIISNSPVRHNDWKRMTYDEFKKQAYGRGISTTEDLIINVADLERSVYQDIVDLPYVYLFTVNGKIPSFITGEVQNWGRKKIMIVVSNSPVSHLDWPRMSYDDFKQRAYSGLDITMDAIIDVNDLDEDFYRDIAAFGFIHYFSTNGDVPEFLLSEVENWDAASEPSTAVLKKAQTEKVACQRADSGDGAKVVVFGSSKGGTGKTFTAIMSTYQYARKHPNERIALVDFDIVDGQVGVAIHKLSPTLGGYYTEYQKGERGFDVMSRFSTKGNSSFPQNVDFYLAPTSGNVISNDNFWINVLQNCNQNYDLVVFDTGIDYLNITPISYAYKIADRIVILTTTSIKSVNSISKQIDRLTGVAENPVFDASDDIASRLNIVVTQMVPQNKMNERIISTLRSKVKVMGTFGVITELISRAEYFGEWDVLDINHKLSTAFERLISGGTS